MKARMSSMLVLTEDPRICASPFVDCITPVKMLMVVDLPERRATNIKNAQNNEMHTHSHFNTHTYVDDTEWN